MHHAKEVDLEMLRSLLQEEDPKEVSVSEPSTHDPDIVVGGAPDVVWLGRPVKGRRVA